MLMKRELLRLVRHRVTKTRFVIILGAAILYSVAFWNIGEESLANDQSFASHLNAVIFLTRGPMFIMILFLIDIAETVPLFVREYTSSYFCLLSYALSTVTVEIMLLCLLSLVSSANQILWRRSFILLVDSRCFLTRSSW